MGLGTNHLRRRNFFTFFDPYLPPPAVFYYYVSVGKFYQFLTPPPLQTADVLNGWSLIGRPTDTKVEKILKGSLDSIPSAPPSVKIQIMAGKFA
jgi:hypothetical protein